MRILNDIVVTQRPAVLYADLSGLDIFTQILRISPDKPGLFLGLSIWARLVRHSFGQDNDSYLSCPNVFSQTDARILDQINVTLKNWPQECFGPLTRLEGLSL